MVMNRTSGKARDCLQKEVPAEAQSAVNKRDLCICGTFGPTCHDKALLRKMAQAGMNCMRLNTNHASLEEAAPWLQAWKEAAQDAGIAPQLLADLQKGSLRTALSEPVALKEQEIVPASELGLPEIVLQEMQPGDLLLADDGRIRLQVQEESRLQVLQGGQLENHKNVCLDGRSLSRPMLSEQDHATLLQAAECGVTGIMVPFVEGPADLQPVKQALNQVSSAIRVLAKIETGCGAENIESILEHCDEVVIARGDLGNDMGLENLPVAAEKVRRACLKAGKPWMVVTQMLDSMRHSPVPTRAEVSDVFYAVLLGASSIMLTNETAASDYPLEAVEMFCKTAGSAMQMRKADQLGADHGE